MYTILLLPLIGEIDVIRLSDPVLSDVGIAAPSVVNADWLESAGRLRVMFEVPFEDLKKDVLCY